MYWGVSVLFHVSVFMRTDDFTVCPFRRCAGDKGDQLSSPSWWSLPSPLELEISVLLTQAENQGHVGLSVQLWSGKICRKHQWILDLLDQLVRKCETRHFGDESLAPCRHPTALTGMGMLHISTPPLLSQQKGQLTMLLLLPLRHCLHVCGPCW